MHFEPLGGFAAASGLAAMASLVCAPATAFAVDYLSAEQAARALFPDADHFQAASVDLDAASMQQLAARGIRARSAHWTLQVARRGPQVLGYLVVDAVVGKLELIDYAVGLAPQASVVGVEVLSYRESHGQEIRSPAWRRQFTGKGPGAAIQDGEDIANISGATLSCTHVTEGVRRIVAVVDLARRAGALPS